MGNRVWAFVKRDFLTSASYRLAFAWQLLAVLFQVITFYYLAQVFGTAVSPTLAPYGGSYFAFLLVGLALNDYLYTSLGAFSESIRQGQTNGTLEIMLLSPTRLAEILLASSLWGYLFTTLRVFVYVVAGVLLFGVDLGQANLPVAVAFLGASILCYGSVGLISASFIMVFKKGDPVVWAFGALSNLLAGVLYPVAVLPDWLQLGSRLLPLTYSLQGMRLALLQGDSLAMLWTDLLTLLGFSALLMPLGFWIFRLAVRRAKVDGSLAHY